MLRFVRVFACLPLLILASCDCDDDDDDCWWDTDCYWSGCCYTCYEVEYCSYYYSTAASGSEDLDFEATVQDAGSGKIDIRVQLFGKRVDGTAPLGVRLLGPGIAELRRESPKDVWGFYGIPASDVERIEAVVAGTDIRVEREAPLEDFLDSPRDDSRDRFLGTVSAAPAPAVLALGTDYTLGASWAEDLAASGTAIGLEIEVFQPGEPGPFAMFLREGETSTVQLDRAGRWVFRSTLLTDDSTGEPSADSVVVEETEIDVR